MSLIQSDYPFNPELSCLVDYDIHNKRWVIKKEATSKQKTELLNLISETEDLIKKRFSSRYQKVPVIIE